MAYELLAGAHPFAGRTTAQQLIAAHIAETPAPIALEDFRDPRAAGRARSCAAWRKIRRSGPRRPPSCSPRSTRHATPHAGGAVPGSVSRAAPAPGARRRRGDRSSSPPGRGRRRADRRGRSPTGGAAAATRPTRWIARIAVLPLANLSGDKADDYFGIGLAEEITRALAKNGVRVIGRVSAACASVARGSTSARSRRSSASARCSPAPCSAPAASCAST